MEQVENRQPGTFKPGQSGNPKGRPKKEWTWRGELLKAAEEIVVDPETGAKLPAKTIMARRLTEKGWKQSDVQAIKEFGDRIDGKASQGIELTGRDGMPVEQSITVKFV